MAALQNWIFLQTSLSNDWPLKATYSSLKLATWCKIFDTFCQCLKLFAYLHNCLLGLAIQVRFYLSFVFAYPSLCPFPIFNHFLCLSFLIACFIGLFLHATPFKAQSEWFFFFLLHSFIFRILHMFIQKHWLHFYQIQLFVIFLEQTSRFLFCLTTQGNCYSGVRLFMQFFIFLINELVESPLKSEI